MARPTLNPSQRALKEHLQKDAPSREASVARFMTFAAAASGAVALVLGPLIGWRLSLTLGGLLALVAAWYAAVLLAITRGHYVRAFSWLNVALEVSIPAVIFTVDFRLRGAEYALTAPPLVIISTLVALSALRGSQVLAVAAGSIAALEHAAQYFVFAAPHLPPDALLTLQPPLIATRVFLLFCSGLVTAVFVGHLNRRAAVALAAVREKDVLGKYLMGERIGMGGMAEVYLATYCPEGGFEKQVAVKKVLPNYAQDDGFVQMFRQEAELCSRLAHPNVVQVLDFGRFGDTYYLAMEWVDGTSLKRVLDGVRGVGLPLAAVTHLGIELLSALDYVHRREGRDGAPLGLVHRDVNPPNVLVSKQGEVKLTDFGIARARLGARLTHVGTVKGKPGYFAPEQLAGDKLDGRADLFAAGITLHEALTGHQLFPHGADDASLLAVLEQPIPRPSQLRRDVPPALDAVVMGLLEREVKRRTPSGRIAADALRAVTGEAAALPFGQKLLAQATRSSPVLSNTVEVTKTAATPDAETLPSAGPRRQG